MPRWQRTTLTATVTAAAKRELQSMHNSIRAVFVFSYSAGGWRATKREWVSDDFEIFNSRPSELSLNFPAGVVWPVHCCGRGRRVVDRREYPIDQPTLNWAHFYSLVCMFLCCAIDSTVLWMIEKYTLLRLEEELAVWVWKGSVGEQKQQNNKADDFKLNSIWGYSVREWDSIRS